MDTEQTMTMPPTYKVAVSRMSLDHKLPQGDPQWPVFNSSFENLELGPFDIATQIYTGHALTTWHKDNWRNAANYLCGQSIGLDMDTEDERSTLTSLKADKFVAHYASIVHTTISHKPEAPRARVLFLLDQPIMQPINYTLAAAALLWVFGTADRACRDCCRFFYSAPGCDLEYLGNVLPMDMVKHLIAQYQEAGRQEKRRHESHFTTTPDQQEVADALSLIPPSGIDYDEWLQVLMGIHAAYGDAGLGLAENWADGKPGEVERKMRGFKPTGNTTGTVTIATVFGLAKRFGWTKKAA